MKARLFVDLSCVAFAHGEPAQPRAITIFPQAGTEHTGNGTVHVLTCADFASDLREVADMIQPKGAGFFWTPGRSSNGRKRDQDCAAVEWLGLDHDAGVTWDRTLATLRDRGAAFVAYESPSATETLRKWRLALPLRSPLASTGDVDKDRYRWKAQLYPTAQRVLSEAFGLTFDPATKALLQRFYPSTKREAAQKPRQVVHNDGAAFDIEALWRAAVDAGVVESKPAPTYDHTDGEATLVAAFKAAGWVVRDLGDKVAVRCPWEAGHTERSGDTSTVIFASGVFHCSHAHCSGRRQGDVVAELPDDARDLYDELSQVAGVAPHWPGPTEDREAALARQNETIRSWVETAAKHGAARAEFFLLRAEAHAAIELTRQTPRIFTERKRIVAEKRAATVKIKAEVEARHGLKIDAEGDRVLVCGAQGTGKTTTLLGAVARLPEISCVRMYCQTLAKADETAADYAELGGKLPVYVVRGRMANDPERSAEKPVPMCRWWKIARDAAGAGVNVGEEICPHCPHFGDCGYREQSALIKDLKAGLFVMSQDYAFCPCPAPAPQLVVFDEDVTRKAAGKTEMSPDRITSQTVDAETQETLLAVREIIETHRDCGLAELRYALTITKIRAAAKALRALEEKAEGVLCGAQTKDEIEAAIEALDATEAHKVYLLLRQIEREWPTEREALQSVVYDPHAPVKVGDTWERQARVFVHYLKEPQIAAKAPVLVLDGTGSPDLNARLFDRCRTEKIAIERNARVAQVCDNTFSEATLAGIGPDDERAAKLRAEVRDYVLQNKGRRTLVVTYGSLIPGKDEKPRPEHDMAIALQGAGIELAHFGALRGLNVWKDCDTAFIVGRLEPNPATLRDMARAWVAEDEQPLTDAPERYPRETRGRRMRDGTQEGEPVNVHPDPRCQTLLEQVREAEIVQAVDRLRLVYNAEPKRVFLLTSVVVDLAVDDSATWRHLREDGSRIDRALRLPVLPLSAEWWAKTFNVTERTAKRDLQCFQDVKKGHFAIYISYCKMSLYRLDGQKRPSRALIRTDVTEPKAALEALVGPTATFELEEPFNDRRTPGATDASDAPTWETCPAAKAYDADLDRLVLATTEWPEHIRQRLTDEIDARTEDLPPAPWICEREAFRDFADCGPEEPLRLMAYAAAAHVAEETW